MPRFSPFPALRYCTDRFGGRIDDLVAPPYDVLSESDLNELNAISPFNITHVDVPRERDGAGRYEHAAAVLAQWIVDGVIVSDECPSFTVYRLGFTDAMGDNREIVGVLGGCEVGPYGDSGVHAHERITPKASTDRFNLTTATSANLSPIWGLSLASGLTDLLIEPGDPIAAVKIDGVTHSIERVERPDRIEAIIERVGSDDVLIADGHHRYGVAQQYREVAHRAGQTDSLAEETLMFVSELIEDQLSVKAIHRLYSNVRRDDLLKALERMFERSFAGPVDNNTLDAMTERGALCLVHADGTGDWLIPRPGVFDAVRSLDGVWLETAFAEIDHDVTYQHDVDEVTTAVADGSAVAAVLVRPVSVVEIERTAREGILMPSKSTFFTPKLLTGLVIRSLR